MEMMNCMIWVKITVYHFIFIDLFNKMRKLAFKF